VEGKRGMKYKEVRALKKKWMSVQLNDPLHCKRCKEKRSQFFIVGGDVDKISLDGMSQAGGAKATIVLSDFRSAYGFCHDCFRIVAGDDFVIPTLS
jgi:hypothetical protein